MSSNAPYIDVLRSFSDATVSTLKEMTELNATVGELFEDTVEDFKFKGHVVATKTSGSICGMVLLHNYYETALAIGNKLRLHLLGENTALKEINDDMSEVLKEWANTIIGNATNVLPYIVFDPPFFILDAEIMRDYLVGVETIYWMAIHVPKVGRFYYNYLLYPQQKEAALEEKKKSLSTDKKILVVDDSPIIRKLMRLYLRSLGYENVLEAENGVEAILIHTREKPAIIFMDLVMPKARGDEALKRIRDKDKNTPIIMLSSVSDKGVIEDCKKIGLTGYIVKPLTSETGPDALKKYLYE